MKRAAQLVSLAALAGTIVPPVLFFTGRMDLDADEVVDAGRDHRVVRRHADLDGPMG